MDNTEIRNHEFLVRQDGYEYLQPIVDNTKRGATTRFVNEVIDLMFNHPNTFVSYKEWDLTSKDEAYRVLEIIVGRLRAEHFKGRSVIGEIGVNQKRCLIKLKL